jgi:hypothetical protein
MGCRQCECHGEHVEGSTNTGMYFIDRRAPFRSLEQFLTGDRVSKNVNTLHEQKSRVKYLLTKTNIRKSKYISQVYLQLSRHFVVLLSFVLKKCI